MANQYVFGGYQQQYSPPLPNGTLSNTSPTFNNTGYAIPGSSDNGHKSSPPSTSGSGSSYSSLTPRLRYYLSKSFDAEDDMEFCPEIPDFSTSPTIKKFNPYTASIFSPTSAYEVISGQNHDSSSPSNNAPQSPRVHTPRMKRPIEIINPQTKMRVSSPAIGEK